MNVLLTGAAGFIGSEVARIFVAEGCQVHAILRPTTDFWRIRDILPYLHVIPCDLGSGDSISSAIQGLGFDMCVHSAWYAKPVVCLKGRENLDSLNASIRLLTLLADSGCKRFVGVGSYLEYDHRAGYLSEESPEHPESLYGASKLSFKNIAEKLLAGTDMTFAWLRIFNLFGPRENHNRLLPAVICGLLQGKRVPLTPGEQWMDFLHVHDVACAIRSVAGSSLTGTVNIGSGQPVQVKTVVHTAAAYLGNSELLDFGALPYNPLSPPFSCANNKRLRDTGWCPKFTLESGLRNTVDWWRSITN